MGGSFHSHLTIVKPVSKEAGFVVWMNTDNTMTARANAANKLWLQTRKCPVEYNLMMASSAYSKPFRTAMMNVLETIKPASIDAGFIT